MTVATTPSHRWHPRWIATLVIAAGLVACSPGAEPSATSTGNILTGTFELTAANAFTPPATPAPNIVNPRETPAPTCAGTGGYGDIRAGAQVVVRDAADTVVATGELEPGTPISASVCRFTFTVDDVPDADFYSIEVSHRGGLTYSRDELEALGWTLALSLGD